MSPATSKNLAIVPARNEQGSIAQVVRGVQSATRGFDVLVVDDDSTDATASVALAAGARVITHPFSLGIGGAKQSGYVYAYEHGYEAAVVLDGDGQHSPQEISTLMDAMQRSGADLVCGSRFGRRVSYKSGLARRLGTVMLAATLSRLCRQKVTDPTSGFRLCNRRALERFARDRPHDRPEEPAVLMARDHGLVFCEVPVSMRERIAGDSSIGPMAACYYMFKALSAGTLGTLRSSRKARAESVLTAR